MNDFNFFIPIDESSIEKAAKEPIESRYDNMLLEGVASDNSKDIEGEVLEPSGYVTSYFLNGGYINYEHLAKKSPKFLIGEPIDAKVVNNDFKIKAKLWKSSDVARDTWDKILEMKKEGSKRRPGWSIEGKALSRDPMNPKRITKALITNVALTFNPVNGNTWADIVKGVQKEDYVEPEYEQGDDTLDYILEFEKDGKKFRVGKDYKVFEVKKSMGIDNTKPLVPESLEKKPKSLQFSEIKKSIDNLLKYKWLIDRDDNFGKRIIEILKK